MWEYLREDLVHNIKNTYLCVYALNKNTCELLNTLGINNYLIRWGIHPSMFKNTESKIFRSKYIVYYPVGYCTQRKNVEIVYSKGS